LRDIKRLIFYKLIKCEILRFDDSGVDCRHEVQKLSKRASSRPCKPKRV